ncbi:MAG TPA: hypothetical protein DEQ30_02730 [Porphyromonadaceae bacterium]|nr:hypothetical protein [Porphyromonadaceae bacterium]
MSMNDNPPVSVIMPVYNVELYVMEAIDSILCQTFSDFEFIIIDDGSTDNTWNIVQSYNDSRIITIQNDCNIGNYPSRNKGIKVSKGKFIVVMDGDDIAMPERLKKQLLYFEKNPDVIALGTNCKFNSDDNKEFIPLNHEDVTISLLKDFNILHPSLMIRKDAILSLGGYDEAYKCAADYDLLCHLALLGKVENLPEILMMHRIHESQISQTKRKEQNEFARSIRRKYQLNFINKYKSDAQGCVCLEEIGIPEIGLAICFYTFADKYNYDKYKKLADKTIDVLYKIITKDIPVCIEGGLCGLGCGFQYLIRNKFLDGDIDEVLEDIDHRVITILKEGSNKEYIKDMLFYLNYRISKSDKIKNERTLLLSSFYSDYIKKYNNDENKGEF